MVNEKIEYLNKVKVVLKSEFVGLDKPIDEIIQKITPWYLFPEQQSTPLIINLWGITGTGKTQIVKSLANHLNASENKIQFFSKDSLEINSDKDNFLFPEYFRETQSYIYLIDEFQNTRTLTELGFLNNERQESTQILWNFLNDGTCKMSIEWVNNAYYELLKSVFYYAKNDPEQLSQIGYRSGLHPDVYKFVRSVGDAKLKELKGVKFLQEISRLFACQVIPDKFPMGVIFICGNLDEAYSELVEDLEVLEADDLYERIQKVTEADVKKALLKLFRAEQVARLGANHIVFPSFTKDAYLTVIKNLAAKSVEKVSKISVQVKVDDSLIQYIYQESVTPSQGLRNVLSYYNGFVDAKILEYGVKALTTQKTEVEISVYKDHLIVKAEELVWQETLEVKKSQHELYDEPVRSIIANHEAGHALLYYLLKNKAPKKIVTKSVYGRVGGYVKMDVEPLRTKKALKESIIIALGGYVAEKMVNGEENVTEGSYGDFKKASNIARMMVQNLGMGINLSVVDVASEKTSRSFEGESDQQVEFILKECLARAEDLILSNQELFNKIAKRLTQVSKVSESEFLELVKLEEKRKGG